jgi:uncharacterized protein YjlB
MKNLNYVHYSIENRNYPFQEELPYTDYDGSLQSMPGKIVTLDFKESHWQAKGYMAGYEYHHYNQFPYLVLGDRSLTKAERKKAYHLMRHHYWESGKLVITD